MNLEKQSEMLEAIYWMVVEYCADDMYLYPDDLSGEDAISILEEYGLICRANKHNAYLIECDTTDNYFFHDKILEKQQ